MPTKMIDKLPLDLESDGHQVVGCDDAIGARRVLANPAGYPEMVETGCGPRLLVEL